jgi:2-desacetyl-2-hydroxyethyl bacteriochlorophyllide A dehydrogenase
MQVTEIVLTGVDEPERQLQVRTREIDAPGRGQALLRVEAAGVAFAEQQMRRGRYPLMPRFPFVPGYDAVGVVEALGEDTSGIRITVGQRALAIVRTGGWADRIVVPAAALVPVPDAISAEQAEALAMNGLTAWQMLHRVARVKARHTVLVHGASGGVGTLLVQLASAAGATVIGTASTAKHDAVLKLGAHHVIDYRDDVPAAVRRLAANGVDAIFDHVGGRTLRDSWRLLGRRGTLVSYGSHSTVESGAPLVNFARIMGRVLLWNLTPRRGRATFYYVPSGLGRLQRRTRARMRADFAALFDLAAKGKTTGVIADVLPLEKAAQAIRQAESGAAIGKVLLAPAH